MTVAALIVALAILLQPLVPMVLMRFLLPKLPTPTFEPLLQDERQTKLQDAMTRAMEKLAGSDEPWSGP